MNGLSRLCLSAALCCGMLACKAEQNDKQCSEDSDCSAGFVCQTAIGECRCQAEDACGPRQECNSFGFCQTKAACRSNTDCAAGTICNEGGTSSAQCIPSTTCGTSVHCELGQFCDPQTQTCKVGCRSTGDCRLGDVCVGGQCTAGHAGTDCNICPASPDPDATYCDHGELCTTDGSCTPHPNKNELCKSCGQTTRCTGNTICLVDDTVPNGNYCSPTCQTFADCPSGYGGCDGLQLVVAECTGSGACANGGKCLTASEGTRGFCECKTQSDCDIYEPSAANPFGACFMNQCPDGRSCSRGLDCACQQGRCLGTDFPCTQNGDCAISCVTVTSAGESFGICQTNAKACGKGSGVTCTELKTGTPDCRE